MGTPVRTWTETIDPGIIADLLKDCRKERKKPLTEIARSSGLPVETIYAIRDGQQTMLSNVTAGRILAALGEPMHPVIAKAYRAWLRLQREQTS